MTTRTTTRALNRALLARQLLLERATVPVEDALGRLIALQAQLARPPFLALWTRLRDFSRDTLTRAAHERRIVRATLMRGTIHLLRADDYRALRPLYQSVFNSGLRSLFKEWVDDVDLATLDAEARAFFARGPATFDAYRKEVKALRPDDNERLPAYAARMRIPLVQVPTLAPWGWPAAADFALADEWLGTPVPTVGGAPRDIVRRYLSAFGPATIVDAQCWTGLPALRGVIEQMSDELIVLRDENGRELFDLPDAPRPSEDVLAPVRFLPEFDNAILGHEDRARIVDDVHRPRLVTKNLQVPATVLVDGRVIGTWTVAAKRRSATLTIAPFAKAPSKKVRAELEREGESLLGFLEPEVSNREVVIAQ